MTSRLTKPEPESADSVDHLLARFFRSAMPDPWPRFGPVEAPERQTKARGPTWSRLALAASVGMLMVTQFWLAHSFKAPESPGLSSTGALEAKDQRPRRRHAVSPASDHDRTLNVPPQADRR